ncbi:hypothetical protein PG989_003157 [Apiospora arundinis]|uniref:Uncharacterized protein n=1 Tax=Apiospora arundinis TaxID=335852 RepID=A0ABR2I1J8_9PEZI
MAQSKSEAMMDYLKILQSAAQGVPAVLARLYSVAVTMFGFLGAAIYWITIPLRYPAYYAFALASRVVSVLLSPLWFTWRLFSGTTLMVLNFVSGLKMLFNFLTCAIIVGLLAGFTVHGISRLIAMLLRVDPSQRKIVAEVVPPSGPSPPQQQHYPTQNGVSLQKQQQQKKLPEQQKSIMNRRLGPGTQLFQGQRIDYEDITGFDDNDDDMLQDDYYYVEANDGDGESLAGSSTTGTGRFGDLGTTTTSSESAFNNSTSLRRRGVQKPSPILSFGGSDMYKRDWRSLSSNMKSSAGSRRVGSIKSLLAQTIHEESSESDSL